MATYASGIWIEALESRSSAWLQTNPYCSAAGDMRNGRDLAKLNRDTMAGSLQELDS